MIRVFREREREFGFSKILAVVGIVDGIVDGIAVVVGIVEFLLMLQCVVLLREGLKRCLVLQLCGSQRVFFPVKAARTRRDELRAQKAMKENWGRWGA